MAGERVQSITPPGPSLTEQPLVARRWLPRLRLPGLHLYASERKLLLFLFDLALLSGALLLAVAWRTDWIARYGGTLPLLAANWRWFVTLAVLWFPVALLLESYDLARAASAPYSILSAGAAVLITTLLYMLLPYLTPPLIARGLLYVFVALALGGVACWRGFYAVLFVQPTFQQRALVVGAGAAAQALLRTLQPLSEKGNPFRGTGYQIVALLDDDEEKRGEQIQGVFVLGGSDLLPALAQELEVDEIVLAITHRHTIQQSAFDALLACRERGLRITTMPALYERLLGRVPVEHIGRSLDAVLPLDRGPLDRLYAAFKPVPDRLCGAVGLLVLGLVAPCVAVANRLCCPGPLFYTQTRVGRGGRCFEVVKFRTMRPDAERGTGAVWSSDHDPRITPVGRWLRKLRLDELPQVVNVLRGEMSLIGPRPERPEFVAMLARQIPYYRARHAVKPGLTGWAQVRFGYGNSVEDSRLKLEYDLYYVRHAGFYLDALILLKTLAVVLKLQGQ